MRVAVKDEITETADKGRQISEPLRVVVETAADAGQVQNVMAGFVCQDGQRGSTPTGELRGNLDEKIAVRVDPILSGGVEEGSDDDLWYVERNLKSWSPLSSVCA